MNSEKRANFFDKIKLKGLPRINKREFFRGTVTAAVSFLLGICPLPLSVYPLGIAFFCAASGSAVYAAAGLFAAALVTPLDPTAYLLASFLAVILRILVRLFIDIPSRVEDKPKLTSLLEHIHGNFFCEALPLRVACAAVSVFALSLHPIFTGGFRYYDLFGAIFAITVSSIAVVVFHGGFSHPEAMPEDRYPALRSKVARLAISAVLCLSLSSLPIRGVDLGLAAAFMLTVNFCLSDGLVESCLSAVLCGTLCGFENIPVLVISSFTAYCVLDVSPSLAAAVACIAGSVCGIMISGSSYMTKPFLSLLLGCAIYTTAKKLAFERITLKSTQTEKSTDTVTAAHLSVSEALLKNTYSSFGELSQKFPALACSADMLDSVLSEAASEAEEDTRLSHTISRRLYELGFGKVSTTVIGKRATKIYISGERLAGRPERLNFIRRRAEELAGFPLTQPKFSEDGRKLTFLRESCISYHHSVSVSPREEPCGDTADVFYDRNRNYLYALICDGMGSGKEANEISVRASSIIKPLLLGGLSPQNAVKALSTLLSQNSDAEEISTTVDLMRIDLYTGEGVAIKCGAAPSYIKRGGEIIRLSARTLPLGILETSEPEQISFSAKENDVIVLVSDGVSECESDSLPLLDHLNSKRTSSPKDLTDGIIELSRKNGREDDLSVIAVKIFPQNY